VDSSFVFRVTQYAGNHGWALSPEGTRLAIGLSTTSGDDIWIKALPRGPVSRVTYGNRPESRPRWTADGRSIIAVAPDGVILRRADGTGSDSLLWPGLVDEAMPSPDGNWLLLRMGARAATSGGRDIYGLKRGDSVVTPLVVTPYDENAIALSPDGRWLVYESDETGRVEVFIRPFPDTDGAKVQVSSGGGSTPLWARNGREVFFLSGDNFMMAAPVSAGPQLQIGEPQALFQRRGALAGLGTSWYTPWDVAPDGRFIMVRSVDPDRDAEVPLIVVENWFQELAAKVAR
jgi:serine/threonine-protein kinase